MNADIRVAISCEELCKTYIHTYKPSYYYKLTQYCKILEQMDLNVSLPLHLYCYSISEDYVCVIIQLQSTFHTTIQQNPRTPYC